MILGIVRNPNLIILKYLDLGVDLKEVAPTSLLKDRKRE